MTTGKCAVGCVVKGEVVVNVNRSPDRGALLRVLPDAERPNLALATKITWMGVQKLRPSPRH